jgi:hypothetical protein
MEVQYNRYNLIIFTFLTQNSISAKYANINTWTQSFHFNCSFSWGKQVTNSSNISVLCLELTQCKPQGGLNKPNWCSCQFFVAPPGKATDTQNLRFSEHWILTQVTQKKIMCSPVSRYQHFSKTHCFNLVNFSWWRQQISPSIFYPDDGGSGFLQNIGVYLPPYMAWCVRRP